MTSQRTYVIPRGILRFTGLAVALIFFCPPLAYSQTASARLSGRTMDPQGAAIPGVELMATEEATGVETKASSNETGIYLLPPLRPGVYALHASSKGFKTWQQKSIVLETGQSLDINITMELGELTESVTVTGEVPLLKTATATVSQFFDNRNVSEMPLAGRRALELVGLSAGAVFVNYAYGMSRPNFSVSGGRVQNQMFSLDGGNIQNMRLGIGQVDTDPPVEALKELRVVQNAYSAEYGGSAGGVIVSTTKNGTNQFHGSGYEFFQNDALNAAGRFAPVANGKKVKAPLRFNLFGGTIGGPIRKNRTFFFASVEGTRRGLGNSQILTVPTELQRAGDFSRTFNAAGQLIPIYDPATTVTDGGRVVRTPFAGNVIPSARISTPARNLLQYWPMPNRAPANLAGAQNLAGNVSQNSRRDSVLTRIDHVFSDRNRFFFRMMYNRDAFNWSSLYQKPEADPRAEAYSREWQTTYVFSDTHTFSPSLIMDTQYTFGNRYNYKAALGTGSKAGPEAGLQGVPDGAFPAITPAGVAAIGATSQERSQFPIRQHQIISTLTKVQGSHLLKFGGELRRSRNYDVFSPLLAGQYDFQTTGTGLPGTAGTGVGFASFLAGFVNGFSMRATDPLDRAAWYLAGFLQDDWKVSKSLTLNLGVRWETDTPMIDANNRMNSFDFNAINPVSGTPGVVKFAGVNGWPRNPFNTDWNNFGPRLGFAWRPLGSERTVIRGGYGIFFEHPYLAGVPLSASLGFERSAGLTSIDNGVTPAFQFGQAPPVGPSSPKLDDSMGAVAFGKSPTTNVQLFEPYRHTGYAMQYNLGVQRQFRDNWSVEVSYVANLGRHIPNGTFNINQVPPSLMGPGAAQTRRPYPQFNQVQLVAATFGVNNYHAGSVQVEKRLSRGLTILSSYTWSRNIGNITEAAGFGENQQAQDWYNRKLDKGPSTIDIVHRFVASSVYDLPAGKGRRWLTKGLLSQVLGGWTVGSIATIQSGGPFTVTMQTDTTNAFLSGGLRANALRDPNLPRDSRTAARWFDTSAFQAPALYSIGNAGRGILRADGRVNFNFSANKNFRFGEERYVQFRGEFFNTFNHQSYGIPNDVMGSPGFGSVTTASDPRAIQLGLRIVF